MPRRQRFPPRQTNLEGASGEEANPPAGGVAGSKRNVLRPPPWDRGGDSESGSFGTWLRRQREIREITLRAIADKTKISMRYLEAMEDDRFDLLPAPVFAKGFLREYARYVGLSPDEVVNHYLAVQQPQELEPQLEPRRDRRLRHGWTYGLAFGLGGLLLLGLLTLLAFWAERRGDNPRAAPPPIAPPPVVAAPVNPLPLTAPAAQPSAPLEVTLDFSQDCWVEALVDGSKRTAELHVQGEAMQIEAKQSVVLTLGNAAAVEVHVNGYPLVLSAKPGEVVHQLKIDLATVRALKEKKS